MGYSFKRYKMNYNYESFSKKMLYEPNRKSNKISVDKGSEFYKRSIK